jgi:hypothetical protein
MADCEGDIPHRCHRSVFDGDVVNRQHRVPARSLLDTMPAHCRLAFCNERRGISLARRQKNLLRGPRLHHAAMAQNHDTIGDLCHDGEIMRDVEGGGIPLPDQLAQLGQNLDLRRDIQRGCRLIEHEKVRLAGHRHGCHGALQLTARSFMRVAVTEGLGFRQIKRREKLYGLGLCLTPAHQAMADWTFADLRHQRHGRVEGRGGTLCNVSDTHAAQGAPPAGIKLADILPGQPNLATRDAAAGPCIDQRRKADGRFSGARFTDQPQHLTATEIEIDIIRQHIAVAGFNAKPANLEQHLFLVSAHRLRSPRRYRPGGRGWRAANRQSN